MSRHARHRPRRSALAAAKTRTRARRVVAMGGMLAAVGGLVTLRSTLAPPTTQALGAAGMAAPAVHGAATRPKAHRSPGAHHSSSSRPSPAARHTATSAPQKPASSRRRVTGNAYDVGYGVVQVRVTMVGSHITDVTPLSLPQGGRSSDISSYAAPQLRKEALAAQSANIDTVSGASYTSAGYARSLQSALDKSRA